MFNSTMRIAVITIAAFLFQIIGPQTNVNADWDNNSDDLPGISSGTTLLLIGAGTVAVVGIVLYARHASKKAREKELKKQQEEREKEKERENEDKGSSGYFDNRLNDRTFSNSFNTVLDKNKKVSFVPYVGLKSTSDFEPNFKKNNFDFSSRAVVVGLAVNF